MYFREDIQSEILALPYTRGTTNTALAIRTVAGSMFNSPQSRDDVPDLMILLTDGGSDDKVHTGCLPIYAHPA